MSEPASSFKMRRVMIQMPEDLYQECKLESRARDISVSALVRSAIQIEVAGDDETVVIPVRIGRDVAAVLELALEKNGNTAQVMLAKHVDRYIETFGGGE